MTHITQTSNGMAEYYLNNKTLSDFGILPSRTNSNHLAITGGFDLPKRTGITFYSWPLENSVQPFVDAEDISFGEREIKFSGTILGNINNNIQALQEYTDSLPELFPLSCKWGRWNVKLKKIDTDNPDRPGQLKNYNHFHRTRSGSIRRPPISFRQERY